MSLGSISHCPCPVGNGMTLSLESDGLQRLSFFHQISCKSSRKDSASKMIFLTIWTPLIVLIVPRPETGQKCSDQKCSFFAHQYTSKSFSSEQEPFQDRELVINYYLMQISFKYVNIILYRNFFWVHLCIFARVNQSNFGLASPGHSGPAPCRALHRPALPESPPLCLFSVNQTIKHEN